MTGQTDNDRRQALAGLKRNAVPAVHRVARAAALDSDDGVNGYAVGHAVKEALEALRRLQQVVESHFRWDENKRRAA